MIEQVELETDGIRLIPLELKHATELYDTCGEPQVWQYLSASVQSVSDLEQVIVMALNAQAEGTELPFTIVDKSTNRLVGSTRYLDISTAHRQLEIGWTWLSPTVWRTAVNTACKYVLLRHAFETLGVVRVQIKTDGRNLRSQKAIERLGAVKEGVLRRHRVLPDGYIRDSVYYSILDDEWPVVKARLEAWMNRP